MLRNLLIGVLFIFCFSGCLKSKSSPCNSGDYDPCGIKASAAETGSVENYLTANNIVGASLHCSGMYYLIENPGTGTSPTVCSNIVVNYTGWLSNGTMFDSGNPSNSMALSNLIAGWKNVLPLLKTGGKVWLYIPASLAYGAAGYGPVPGNTMVVFHVELLSVQ